MPRPKKCRWIYEQPGVTYFKPQGIPMSMLTQAQIGFDELEALRLADMEGMSQEEAAPHMNVSRATFGRIVAQARFKIASALVAGKAIRIGGGDVSLKPSIPPYRWQAGRGRGGRGWE
jgi:predicted DNA-binding protein (UPF0251 family)